MEVSCTVIEPEPNSRYRVENWVSFTLENIEKAQLTLEKGKVTVESFIRTG